MLIMDIPVGLRNTAFLILWLNLCTRPTESYDVLITTSCFKSILPALGKIPIELLRRGHNVHVLSLGGCQSLLMSELDAYTSNITFHEFPDAMGITVSDNPSTISAVHFVQSYESATKFFELHAYQTFDVAYCDSYSIGILVLAEIKRIPVLVYDVSLPQIRSDFYGWESWDPVIIRRNILQLLTVSSSYKAAIELIFEQRTNLVLQGSYLTREEYIMGFASSVHGALITETMTDRYRLFRFIEEPVPLDVSTLSWLKLKSPIPIVVIFLPAEMLSHILDVIQLVNAEKSSYRFVIIGETEDGAIRIINEYIILVGEAFLSSVLHALDISAFMSDCEPVSVSRSVASKVPIICQPTDWRQVSATRIVLDLNIGVRMVPVLEKPILGDTEDILSILDKNIVFLKNNIQKVHMRVSEYGGVRETVDYIEQVADKRILYKAHDFTLPWCYALIYTSPVTAAFYVILSMVLLISVLAILLYVIFCSRKTTGIKKDM
jgi:hypothetical protein